MEILIKFDVKKFILKFADHDKGLIIKCKGSIE